MKNQYHQHCPRHSPSTRDGTPLLPVTMVPPMMASGMTLTTSRTVMTTRTSATLMMVSRSPKRPPLLPLHQQRRLYSPCHSYVISYTNPLSQLPVKTPADDSWQPIPDFDGMDTDDIFNTTEPYLNALFPTTAEDEDITITPPPKDNPIFFTPRSASLWSQLVAPPPLQPPDWIRSRIRRLFLVSLGVPVDLDEILPASKQKKLVLPSVHSPRTSNDSRRSGSKGPSRIKTGQPGLEGGSSSDAGGGTGGGGAGGGGGGGARTGTKRKAPPPEFDLVAAKQLCATTDEALDGMTDAELKEHVNRLEGLDGTAKAVLDYWQQRTDEQIGEREAFEGVIENLVKHARKTRK